MLHELDNDRLVEDIVLLVLYLFSTAVNSLALLVFCRRPGLRTVSNRFVINLLATNLLMTTLLAPALFGEHSLGDEAGAWAGGADAAAVACSLAALLAVLLIAADQHHAVTDPLRCHTRLLQRRPVTLCAATWAVASLAALARVVLVTVRVCNPTAPALWAAELTYASFFMCLGVAGPAAAVCILYARIYRAARSSGLRARANGASALQLHEPHPNLPDLLEEGEGLTLRIDAPATESASAQPIPLEVERIKYGPFLVPPPDNPQRCPSLGSLRAAQPPTRADDDPPRLPSVSSAPSFTPLLAGSARSSQSNGSARPVSIRCRISNASLFRYREESRAARVGLLTATLVMLHVPYAVYALLEAVNYESAQSLRTPALSLLLLAAGVSPFLFALRSRRVQREARRMLLPQKSVWERSAGAAAAAADGQRARAALELLRTLSPGGAESGAGCVDCRSSFSSGGSTQLSSASEE